MYLRLILILTVILTSGCYDASEFQGGQVTDNGFFSYPRYQAKLGKLPLHSAGQYEFNFSGLPNEEMRLQFYIQGKTHADRKTLEILSTQIDVEIKNKNGDIICEASGKLDEGIPDGWVLMSSAFTTAFWHSNCLRLVFSTKESYLLKAKLFKVDPKSPEAQLIATIEGGGNEFLSLF